MKKRLLLVLLAATLLTPATTFCDPKDDRIAELEQQVAELEAKLAELMPDTAQSTSLPSTETATMGEKNALAKAQQYLKIMAFSKDGLKKQLTFEGFSESEAAYGADNCGANWNEQAAIKAQQYLDLMAMSRDGLIDQLIFDGFSSEQANYGASAVGY